MKRMIVVVASFLIFTTSASAEVNSLIARIKAVGREGKGNADAAAAWKDLVREGPDAITDILGGLKDANPTAANWLRAAVDAIADSTVRAGKPLPAGKLEGFVRDTRQDGRARRLAYEWLVRVDGTAPDRLLLGMTNDPSQELRRDAVAVLVKDAQKLFDADNKEAALPAYKKILDAARDSDQVKLAAERLKKLGTDVDLTSHFGFVTRWMVAGSFDNVKGVGFGTVYPPEKGVDLKAVYIGKDGEKVTWKEHTTKEPMGLVDFNKVIGDLHGVTAFAYTVVSSPIERPVEVRAGSNNAIRIFLNGQEIYFREEYHHGMQMDQHVGRGTLKAGRNEILVKVCQNEQKDSWAQQWSFQLRLCDDLGAVVQYSVIK